jgi:hypothetical protein
MRLFHRFSPGTPVRSSEDIVPNGQQRAPGSGGWVIGIIVLLSSSQSSAGLGTMVAMAGELGGIKTPAIMLLIRDRPPAAPVLHRTCPSSRKMRNDHKSNSRRPNSRWPNNRKFSLQTINRVSGAIQIGQHRTRAAQMRPRRSPATQISQHRTQAAQARPCRSQATQTSQHRARAAQTGLHRTSPTTSRQSRRIAYR